MIDEMYISMKNTFNKLIRYRHSDHWADDNSSPAEVSTQ
jgi:hypothetical protein